MKKIVVSGLEQTLDSNIVAARLGLEIVKQINPGKPILITELPRTGDDRKFLITN